MEMTGKERELYGEAVEILERSGDRTVYYMRCPDGDGIMTSFQVFPGIELIYNDFSTASCFQNVIPVEDIMEINHCRKGRFECEFRKGSYVYLGEGDLAVNLLSNAAVTSSFPLGVYQGLSVLLRISEAQEALACFPVDLRINFARLQQRLRLRENCFILRAQKEIQHIFDELYSVDSTIREGYFKLKVLELFLFLSTMDPAGEQPSRRYFPKQQVAIVKHIHSHLTEHLEERRTLSQLAEEYGIGITTLKLCFKEIYGKPPYAYLKEYRMNAAALLLSDGNETIGTVAGRVGYDNASKFAGVFKEIMGVTPLEYRKATRPFGLESVLSE